MIPVDKEIYDSVAKLAGADYAFSYFIKASQNGSKIKPYTVTAWERITGRKDVMRLLEAQGFSIVKPEPWHPDRDRGSVGQIGFAEVKRI